MSRDNHSQCQMLQLHIDQYLDGELESGRRLEFDQHLSHCAACRAEFVFAQKLHMAVVALPRLDCAEETLEPVKRLINPVSASRQDAEIHWWDALRSAFSLAPFYVRYAIPVVAVALLIGSVGREILMSESSSPTPSVASQAIAASEIPPQYSQEEILQAMADLDLALDYLESVGERTGILVRDRFVLQQLEDSFNASFRARDGQPGFDQDGQSAGPI